MGAAGGLGCGQGKLGWQRTWLWLDGGLDRLGALTGPRADEAHGKPGSSPGQHGDPSTDLSPGVAPREEGMEGVGEGTTQPSVLPYRPEWVYSEPTDPAQEPP